jgi:hypothetical protein
MKGFMTFPKERNIDGDSFQASGMMDVTLAGRQKGAMYMCDCKMGKRMRDRTPGLVSSSRFISLTTASAKDGSVPVLSLNNGVPKLTTLTHPAGIESGNTFEWPPLGRQSDRPEPALTYCWPSRCRPTAKPSLEDASSESESFPPPINYCTNIAICK